MKIETIKNVFKKWTQYNMPEYHTLEGWAVWKEEFKKNAPIRYVLFRKIPRYVSARTYRIKMKWYSLRAYIRRHDLVKTGLSKTDWHEFDERMLHANFSLLCQYVEQDCVHYSYKLNWKQKYLPLYIAFFPIKSKESGLQSLEEQIKHNAELAEVKELYIWWTEDRAKRKFPDFVFSGNGEVPYKEDLLERLGSKNTKYAQYYKEIDEHFSKEREQRDLWNKEDDENLLRLMKVRRMLWN